MPTKRLGTALEPVWLFLKNLRGGYVIACQVVSVLGKRMVKGLVDS